MFCSGVISNGIWTENGTWNETVWVLNQILNGTLSGIAYAEDFWSENGSPVFLVTASHCNELCVVNGSETSNDAVEIWNVIGVPFVVENENGIDTSSCCRTMIACNDYFEVYKDLMVCHTLPSAHGFLFHR